MEGLEWGRREGASGEGWVEGKDEKREEGGDRLRQGLGATKRLRDV